MSSMQRFAENDVHELSTLSRDSDESERIDPAYFDNEDYAAQAGLLNEQQSAYPNLQPPWLQRLLNFWPLRRTDRRPFGKRKTWSVSHAALSCRILSIVFSSLLALILFTTLLFPSYTPPPHYLFFKRAIETSKEPGAGNPGGQKVFIAASIFDPDGDLAGGKWGECVLNLINILGPENVYLSIYENDAGEIGQSALANLELKVPCAHTVKFDPHLGFEEVPHVTLPDGSDRVKRIAYLSEARNRALLPLQSSHTKYDKLLYLNDVVFDPIEIAQLLFLTGVEGHSSTSYRAACAVDFLNPVKFYDTYATRDEEGYGVGLPFFPWFTTAGKGKSRRQVLRGSDAVPVRSCWGGAVAFDARFFQNPANSAVEAPKTAGSVGPANMTSPYTFRTEEDLFWEASECCLIHADIQEPDLSLPSGIVMNPYVRTAYDWNTLQWLTFARRFERLYTPIHWMITKAVGMPWYNPRKDEKPWSKVEECVWTGQAFEKVTRVAGHSGFCGRRGLQLMKTNRQNGEKSWENYPVPGPGKC